MRRPHLQHQADDKKRDAAKSRQRQKHKATVPVTPQGARLQPQHHQLSCKRRDRQGNCDVLWLNQGVAAWCWRLTLALSGRPMRSQARGRRKITGAPDARRSEQFYRPLERVVSRHLLATCERLTRIDSFQHHTKTPWPGRSVHYRPCSQG